jgi:UDP-N-acetylmuramoyl-tripeptide--D-alanyl-D-alanine ligase
MRNFSLAELVQPLDGTLVTADAEFGSVAIDSREIGPGQLFVALRGDSFDGHDFLGAVAGQGAVAALVSESGEYPVPALRVRDTRLALGQLAALNRVHFEGPLIGITGSCGKTSVKNMLGAILGRCGSTLATQGNLNNEIGVPLTLLRLEPSHRYAVVEMGAARAGDIDYLCKLARPGIALLLNAMPAHLEGFGSVNGVAHAKGEILSGLDGKGTAIFPAGNEYSSLWHDLAGAADCLDFGFDEGAVQARQIQYCDASGSGFQLQTPAGAGDVNLLVAGRHNIANALAAAAAATAAGIGIDDICAGLGSVEPGVGRLLPLQAVSGAQLIDDSYNANPASVKAAIDVLAGTPGRRWLVLGTMAELGPDSEQMHADVGEYAAEQNIEALWVTGDFTQAAADAFGNQGRCFASREALAAALLAEAGKGDTVLVKGSRSAGMEEVVTALLDESGTERSGEEG